MTKHTTTLLLLMVLFSGGCASLMETPEQIAARIERQSNEQAAAAIRSDPDPGQRAKAARRLGDIGDAASVELLRQALRDPEAVVRAAAAHALRDAEANGQAAASDLREVFAGETDPVAAVTMAWTLRRWGSDLSDGVDVLRPILEQTHQPWARYNAALLLRERLDVSEVAPAVIATLGTTVAREARTKPEDLVEQWIARDAAAVMPYVLAGAEDERPATRAAVARLLYRFKPPVDAMDIVRRRMEDPNADIFNTVLPPPVEATLLVLLADPEAEVRAAAAWAATMCGPAPLAAVPALKALLNDADERVRMNAVHALGPVAVAPGGPGEALVLMSEKLSDPSSRVRADTALALANVGPLPEDVTRRIAARLDSRAEVDANVRAHAAAALANGADIPEVEEALTRGLNDPDPTVVERSRDALERRAAETNRESVD
ncbi:MAG TPA: HEAT repeat domain-containing protein [Kiritimatiellia bacterium]|nr:HEAT repeat domain-containing protein [Kiritimatiellia bacterium]HMP00512.1 HEAT repeat domain-containing protein [Kiritimatiellia bacterium]HMP97618.1 HEAT repeat domain-containing protein [Kiritimatiellia bacterium]